MTKYVCAYMMGLIGNEGEDVSESQMKEILEAGGISIDAEELKLVHGKLSGQSVHELIAAGLEKLETIGGGGGAAPAAGGAAAGGDAGGDAGGAAKVVEEEEEEEEMDFDLFG